MHTIQVIGGGFVLLGICLLAGKFFGGSNPAIARAALVFLPLWAIGAGVNMWIGVSKAGYPVSAELPIALVVFSVPVIAAVLIWWRLQPH